jgi:hypothetical protein
MDLLRERPLFVFRQHRPQLSWAWINSLAVFKGYEIERSILVCKDAARISQCRRLLGNRDLAWNRGIDALTIEFSWRRAANRLEESECQCATDDGGGQFFDFLGHLGESPC